VFNGKLADAEGHFVRLERSLGELAMPMPMSRAALTLVLKEALRRNRMRDALIYLQVSRGVAPRDHAFPKAPVRQAVVITVSPVDRAASEARAAKGVGVVTTPETRWGRCDIKTVGLLPNALAKQKAREVFEREYLNAQMLRFSGNISRTAAFIGMERSALHRKLKSLGLSGARSLEAEEA